MVQHFSAVYHGLAVYWYIVTTLGVIVSQEQWPIDMTVIRKYFIYCAGLIPNICFTPSLAFAPAGPFKPSTQFKFQLLH